jgi:hypothetical protein
LDSSIQDATVPGVPLQKRFLLVVSVLRVRLLPIHRVARFGRAAG